MMIRCFLIVCLYFCFLFSMLVHGKETNTPLTLTQADIQKEMTAYYSKWIGVSAPEIGVLIKDRITGGQIRLQDYKGKKILLYSFNSGDFVDAPDEKVLVDELEALNRTMEMTGNQCVVVGFTYGVMFFLPGIKPPEEINRLTHFPIVNNTNIELPEPYALLLRWPSVIVIDEKGIITAIYTGNMTESLLKEAMLIKPWGSELCPFPESPPEVVRDFSSRRYWTTYIYSDDFSVGTFFKRNIARRGRVYVESQIMTDSVEQLKDIEGKVLNKNVYRGDLMRISDFSLRVGSNNSSIAPIKPAKGRE